MASKDPKLIINNIKPTGRELELYVDGIKRLVAKAVRDELEKEKEKEKVG